jgi:cellular nucleic acid-binding protein
MLHRSRLTTHSLNTMARGTIVAQLSNMASNPYPRPKEHVALVTECEVCNRTMPTKDWPSHKNSKKHRQAEAKDKEAAEGKGNNTIGFGGDTAGFTADTGGFTVDGAAGDPTNSGNDTWATSGNDTAWGGKDFNTNTDTSTFGNGTGGGGGDRACFGCGEIGHQKRECPKGGGGGGDRACFSCGDTGHQKRDCPNGGGGGGYGGGGQACFNCGEDGYVTFCPMTNTMTDYFIDTASLNAPSLASLWVVVEILIVSATTAISLGTSF